MSDDEQPERKGRVTIDLDGKDYPWPQFRLKAISIWHNLDDVCTDVECHVSSSGKGLHFVGWLDEELPFYEEVALRRLHGDDPRRIDMDIQRWRQGLYTGVLFEEKSDREHGKERRFVDVYDALDHIATLRDDGDRMNRLANQGHKGAPGLARRSGL